jgi:hypothetical protein
MAEKLMKSTNSFKKKSATMADLMKRLLFILFRHIKVWRVLPKLGYIQKKSEQPVR